MQKFCLTRLIFFPMNNFSKYFKKTVYQFAYGKLILSLAFLLIFSKDKAMAQCNPSQKYDKIVSGYHQSIALRGDDSFSVWGQTMANNGSSDILTPQVISRANYPNLTGIPLKATIGGAGGGGKDQFTLLTTTHLYAWGATGYVWSPSLVATTTFAKIGSVTGGDTTGLPAGVLPTNVAILFASDSTIAIVTADTGFVYVMTMVGSSSGANPAPFQGDSTVLSSTTWHKVKINATTYLSGVTALRGQTCKTSGAYMALTSSGQVYTWGSTVYFGGGAAKTVSSYAKPMTLPSEFTSSNIPKMIAVTGGHNDANTICNTYYLVSNSGALYALGDNAAKQCGDFTTTERTDWVRCKKTSSTLFTNVSFITVQDHDACFPAVAAITDTGDLWAWGDNNGNLIGSTTTGNLDPEIPGGFTPGTDKAIFAEMGGHTLVYVKQGSTQFCYVGHKTNGSMGDGVSAGSNITSFNCSGTPAVAICGSVPVVPSANTSTITPRFTSIIADSVATDTILVQLKTAAGVNLTTTGGTVTMSTTSGYLSSVVDNNNGTYTAILTSSHTPGTATISFTINAITASHTATVNFSSCSPAISSHPGGVSLCSGSNASFTVSATGTGLIYQWQENTGSGFANLSNGGVYSGVTTNTLTLTGAGTGLNGYLYRCNVSGSCTPAINSNSATLTVNPYPSAISGSATVVVGFPVTLTSSGSGSWTSSNTSVATVGSASGIVSGVSAGTTIITYAFVSGCYVTKVETVNTLAPITGPTTVFAGSTITLADITTGGTWSSSNTGVATIGSTGIVLGVASGTTVITYAITGGYTTYVVSVNSLAPITGPTSVFAGNTITLADATSGGTWSSSNTSVAPINSSGVVLGVAAGTTVITYTVGADYVTYSITVNTIAPITGLTSVLVGNAIILSDATSGGSWSSSNSSVATIGLLGNVTGVSHGTTTITYAIGSAYATYTVEVDTMASITGLLVVLVGNTITLADTTAGGTWSSNNNTIATIGTSGIVTGINTGTTTITYTIGSAYVTYTVEVDPISPITGATIVLVGNTTTLADTTAGGVWSSSNTSVATIGTSGIVTGVSSGTTTITYTVGSGYVTYTMETDPIAPITGSTSVLVSNTITLSDATSGGNWSSSNTSVATIGSTGVVSGLTTGTTVITYMVGTGYSVYTITVNPIQPITGLSSVLVGNTISLDDATGGGVWSSSNTSVATIGSTGIVTGVGSGTVIITYTVGAGFVIKVITIADLAPITGPTSVYIGNSITLSDATAGGVWTSSNTSVANIGSTGIVTGISSGTTIITYTTGGAYVTYTVEVDQISAITGSDSVLVGNTITLVDSTAGGVWTSSNTSVATIGSTGIVTGVGAGTTIITYSIGSSYVTKVISINNISLITGTSSVLAGSTITLSDATAGGVWSSSNTSVATIGTSGVVSGVSAGTTVITYTIGGSYVTKVITVNPILPISGPTTVIVGNTITLSDATPGGVWTSGTGAIASIGTNGVVTGLSAGTTVITYTIGSQYVTYIVSVSSLYPIDGPSSVCPGSSNTLSDTATGGVWTSGNNAIATIGSASGIVTGVTSGTVIMTYSVSGSSVTKTIVVSAGPAVIGGSINTCLGLNTTLANSVSGGSWSSSNTSIASIGSSSGVLTGVTAGTTTITYKLASGCYVSTVSMVSPIPSAITGGSPVCAGSSFTLSEATPGGVWSSANTSIATVGTSGLVTGAASGTTTISYTLSGSCSATTIVTITGRPTISGPSAVCLGSYGYYTASVAGGLWTSSNTAVATVNCNLGVVSGVTAGSSVISYTLSSGCFSTVTVNVISLAANGGPTHFCTGSTVTLTNSMPGGVWATSDSTLASVSPTTGVVTGLAPGNVVVSYTFGSTCAAVTGITLCSLTPNFGGNAVCIGSTTSINNVTVGGTWTSSNTSIATVSNGTGLLAGTGIVSGVASGTATITYAFCEGCVAYTTVNVNTNPSAVTVSGGGTYCGSTTITATGGSGGTIYFQGKTSGGTSTATASTSQVVTSSGTYYFRSQNSNGCWGTEGSVTVNIPAITGPMNVCIGSTATLHNNNGASRWLSSDTSIAKIDSVTGVITGLASGNATISSTLGSGCVATSVVAVGSIPPAITGPTSVCVGQTITMANAGVGGSWSTSTPTIATVDTNGVVTGVAGGLVGSITYSFGGTCISTTTVAVNALGNIVNPIGGIWNINPLSTCIGQNINLAATVTGGTWSCGTTSIATINSSTGVATGVSSGTAIITYTMASGCYTAAALTVKLLSPIFGPNTVCVGQTITLNDTTCGGSWSTATPTIASVEPGNGRVTGIGGSLSLLVTYTLGSGCSTTYTVSVNALPLIAGAGSVCQSSTTTLTNAITGGTWTSGSSLASINSSGVLTGVNPGQVLISYQVPNGCITTTNLFVNPVMAIAGPSIVCLGQNITLSEPVYSGTWSTSAPTIATIGVNSGIVTGIAANLSANITYTFCTGCKTYLTVSVSPLALTNGPASVCQGQSINLTNANAGGTWSSSSASIATTSASGSVTGMGAGVASISYTLPTGCTALATVTVNPLAPIVGPTAVVVGQTINLTNANAGGTWNSGSPTIATITSGGVVTGVAPNLSSIISYTMGTGCRATTTINVNPVVTLSGAGIICTGQTLTITASVTGGTWSGSAPGVATIGSSSGIVTGIGAGTEVITYSLASGITVYTTVTVNAISAISGPASVCTGATITLTNPVTGGSWSSSNPTVATVGASSGVVNGVSGGTATVTYLVSGGCYSTANVVVNPIAAIAGTTNICVGTTSTLTDAVTGGVWTSSAAGVATIGTGTGIVSGVSAGSATISYVMASGCYSTSVVNVTLGYSITGPTSVCVGQTITLTSGAGGTWSSGSPTIATVTASGVVTGIAGGLTANITYTIGASCRSTYTVSVNSATAIGGTLNACLGMTTTLTNSVAGGTWTSSTPSIATVVSSTGVVTGVSGGTSTISYTLPSGCVTTSVVSIGNLSPIAGPTSVCNGQSITLTNSIAGGTWSSSAPTIASIIPSTGVVTGNAGNLTAVISYTLGSGCRATTTITVNPLAVVSGSATTICAGQGTTLTDAVAGGTWSSSLPSIATIVSGTGVVTGVAAGTTVLSYILPTGCTATYMMSVNPLSPIIGTGAVCLRSSITLSNAISGGTWASSAPTIASVVSTTGVVTGAAANLSATLTYTLGTGCRTTAIVSVNALPAVPAAISGPSSVSISGAPITLTDGTSGGFWTSENVARSTVVAGTGVVTGVGVGTVTISYTVSNASGCTNLSTKVITVGPVPPPHSNTTMTITLNTGSSITLNELNTGGFWACIDCNGIMSLDAETGVVTGIGEGAATINYVYNDDRGTSISVTKVVVKQLPEGITTMANESYMKLMPNPNKGEFTIKGQVNTKEAVTIEVVNMLGQVVYLAEAKTSNGRVEEQIQLNNNLSAGMYLLNLHSANEHFVLHFEIVR